MIQNEQRVEASLRPHSLTDVRQDRLWHYVRSYGASNCGVDHAVNYVDEAALLRAERSPGLVQVPILADAVNVDSHAKTMDQLNKARTERQIAASVGGCPWILRRIWSERDEVEWVCSLKRGARLSQQKIHEL